MGKDDYAELIKLLNLENVFYDERFHPPAPNNPKDGGDVEPFNFTERPKGRSEAAAAI